jgi:hypothetical protein
MWQRLRPVERNIYERSEERRTTMKRLVTLGLVLVAMESASWGSIALNSSRSNIYRVTYPPSVMTSAQATAVLGDLDKNPRADDAALKRILQSHGVRVENIKKILRQPADKTHKLPAIIFLTNPADEPAALAITDEGTPSDKPSKPKNK